MKRVFDRTGLAVLALLLVVVASACGGSRGRANQDPPTYVEVDNQSWLDQTVYVMRSSQRIRLGIVSGSSRQRLRIPPSVIFGATPLRFVADPIGGRAQSTSMEIMVVPGEEVRLTIVR
jgi:hypothetical protein